MNDSFKNAVRGLSRALNALRGQGHGVIGEPSHNQGCPLCSAVELIEQSFYYLSEPAPSSEKALRARCEALAASWDATMGREDFAPSFAEELREILASSPAPEAPKEAQFSECYGCKRDGLQRRVGLCQECGRNKPTDYYERSATNPAVAREDEAQIIEEYADYLYTLAGASVSSETDAKRKRFQSALATLRSRQSQQATDEAPWHITEPDQNGEYGVWAGKTYCVAEGLTLKKAQELLATQAAKPQPSPQGEDAVADERVTLVHWDENDIGTLANALESAIDAYDALRSRLASAQSSAQGEGAREMRDLVESALGTIEATTLGDNGWWRSWIIEARAALERKEDR